jgi:DNA-binding ferritin-like protein
MSASTDRVAKFKERQRALGRKPFNTWLTPEAIRELKQRAKGKTAGEVIEQLLSPLSVASNAQS